MTLTVASEKMASSQNQAMAQIWREDLLCDCEVRVDGRVFPAHRIVLAACSTFMRSAFTKTATANVALEEVEAAVFQAVLEFMYAGTCSFDERLSLAVLQAASQLGIPLLETEMVSHIKKRIDPATCLEVWQAGDAFLLPALVEAAQKCVEEAFVEVAAGDAWLSMAAPWLECLLVSDELAVETEEQVFEALMRWYTAQHPPPSHELLDRLLALVEQGHRARAQVRGHRASSLRRSYGAHPKPRGSATEHSFRFESTSDANGILHHIGTRGGTAAYCNPHMTGDVTSSLSSIGHGVAEADNSAVGRFVQHAHAHAHAAPVGTYTANLAQSWMAVDLGEAAC